MHHLTLSIGTLARFFRFAWLLIALCGPLAQAEIVRFQQVAPGIYRGGQPQTQDDYDRLAELGVQSILNLRDDETVAEEQAVAESMGFNFLNIRMRGFKYPRNSEVRRALDYLTNPSLQPVFVHCRHGKDRTGLIVGLYRVRYEDWSARRAYKEMRAIGFNPLLVPLTTYWWLHARQDHR